MKQLLIILLKQSVTGLLCPKRFYPMNALEQDKSLHHLKTLYNTDLSQV